MVRMMRIGLILLFFLSGGCWAQGGLWASPTYPAAEIKSFSVQIESRFNYHQYKPNNAGQNIRLLLKKYASMDTAEEAFVSRFSAIASLDYPWWLETWEYDSKQVALDFFQQKGLTQDYWLKTWKEQFVGRKIKLKYKIKFQDYVIFTYNVSAPSGQEGFLDVPIVFSQQDKHWLVSLDLRQSPLIRYSPWNNGSDMEVVEYE